MVKFHIQARGAAGLDCLLLASVYAAAAASHELRRAQPVCSAAHPPYLPPSTYAQEYERCGKFIFPVCSRLAGRQVDQTFGIMDVKGVGLSHLTGDVKRLISLLTKYDQVRRARRRGCAPPGGG